MQTASRPPRRSISGPHVSHTTHIRTIKQTPSINPHSQESKPQTSQSKPPHRITKISRTSPSPPPFLMATAQDGHTHAVPSRIDVQGNQYPVNVSRIDEVEEKPRYASVPSPSPTNQTTYDGMSQRGGGMSDETAIRSLNFIVWTGLYTPSQMPNRNIEKKKVCEVSETSKTELHPHMKDDVHEQHWAGNTTTACCRKSAGEIMLEDWA